jgi:phosphoesterase RecJ-like protein
LQSGKPILRKRRYSKLFFCHLNVLLASMTEPVLDFFQRYQHFLITTHLGPDGDAIGSQLALAHFLKKMGKRVTMIDHDEPSYNLMWLPGADDIQEFSGSAEQRKAIAASDAVIVVDTNALERLGDVADSVENSHAPKLLIDHHTNPEDWFDVTYQRDDASSAGELVYEIVTEHDPDAVDGSLIDEDLATLLYTAIMTDTGSFRYTSVTPTVHRIVADLLERGDITPAPIHTSIFDTRTPEGIKLLGDVLGTMTLRYNGVIGYLVVTEEMLERTGATWDDARGLVNYVLSIGSVQAGALFKSTRDGIKISFRSKGAVHVNRWARQFGGGGHRNASGAYLRGEPLERSIERVMTAAPEYIEEIDFPDGAGQLSDEKADQLAEMMRSGG